MNIFGILFIIFGVYFIIYSFITNLSKANIVSTIVFKFIPFVSGVFQVVYGLYLLEIILLNI